VFGNIFLPSLNKLHPAGSDENIFKTGVVLKKSSVSQIERVEGSMAVPLKTFRSPACSTTESAKLSSQLPRAIHHPPPTAGSS
jgi:hypothetical protein